MAFSIRVYFRFHNVIIVDRENEYKYALKCGIVS